MPAPMVTQTQFLDDLAGKLGCSRAEAKRTVAALEDVVTGHLGQARRVKVGTLVQLEAKLKPARPKRKGRNPATGEEITIAAKPASVAIAARPLVGAKNAAPSVAKAKKAIAG